VRQAISHHLTLTLYDLELARLYDRAAREMNGTLRVHVKIDTGLARLGMLPDQVTPFFRSLRNLRHIEVEGLYTHFSSAEVNRDYTRTQLRHFEDALNPLLAAGYAFKYIHAANTAATLRHPEARYNLVRCGIGLYGLAPGPSAALPDGFRPALAWKTSVAMVKTLPSGSYVGYGNTYRTRGVERIAIIPVGYADGFRRAPENWGDVLIGGQRAPLVGRESMDMSAVNVTHIAGVSIGDEVVLIGAQGEACLTADEVARQLGTSSYEVISTVMARVPRV
jgi:alanine racemase